MSQPILYIKHGCPYCDAAMNYLNEQGIDYETIDVYKNRERMLELEKLSGQTRTPTLKWDGDVLPDFGVNDLRRFLAERGFSKKSD